MFSFRCCTISTPFVKLRIPPSEEGSGPVSLQGQRGDTSTFSNQRTSNHIIQDDIINIEIAKKRPKAVPLNRQQGCISLSKHKSQRQTHHKSHIEKTNIVQPTLKLQQRKARRQTPELSEAARKPAGTPPRRKLSHTAATTTKTKQAAAHSPKHPPTPQNPTQTTQPTAAQ